MVDVDKCVDVLMLNHRISRSDAVFICYSFEIPPNDPVNLHADNIGVLLETKLSDLISESLEEDHTIYFNDPFFYKPKADIANVYNFYKETNVSNDYICGICQEPSENDSDNKHKHVCLNKCTHIYHKNCIDIWLTTGKLTCPMCNNQLISNANIDQ